MLFAITLSYLQPPEKVQNQLEAHKTWLVQYIKAGTIIYAGPLQGGLGGFVLAHASGLKDIQDMIDADPFSIHGLTSFDVQACEPAIRADNFPAQWAESAKSIASA